MKKVFQALLIGFLAVGTVHALQNISESIYTASTTVANDTLKRLPGTVPGSELFAVVVASPTTNGILGIYDSSASATNFISSVSLNSVQNPQYFIRVSSGITYTTTGNSNGVTILYRNPNVP